MKRPLVIEEERLNFDEQGEEKADVPSQGEKALAAEQRKEMDENV